MREDERITRPHPLTRERQDGVPQCSISHRQPDIT